MIDNIFKHNSRSYFDVYNALVAAYPQKPTWMFKEIAGLFDFDSELMNRIATDILYPMTRESAYGFATRCDYEPVEADGATDTITFTLTQAKSKTLAVGYQVSGISTATGMMATFELTAAASSGGGSSITGYVKQQKTQTSILVFQIDNQNDFMDYPIIGYVGIIKNSISLVINSLTWTRVDNFDNSGPSDKHFKIIYQSSGKCRIQFGDGITGMKPPQGSSVFATFATTLGIIGRLSAGQITINTGMDSDIASLTNAGASGGNDAESVAAIIRNARANARLRQAVWSKEDLETAARLSSSSVQKALGIPGIGTAGIQIIPTGGGNPSGGLKSAVQTYVQALTTFGVMPLTVSDPNYVATSITASITVRVGFISATVQDLTEFALTLLTCAFDNQITEYYDDNGIDACRLIVINGIWGWAFTSAENDALAFIIDKWKSLLGTREYRDWGQTLEVGDIWIMGNSLYTYGVDVFNLTTPASNVSVNADEIIDTDTITITVV